MHQGGGNRDTLLLNARQCFGAFGRLLDDAQTIDDLDRTLDVGCRKEIETRGQGQPAIESTVQHVRNHIHPQHKIEQVKLTSVTRRNEEIPLSQRSY